MKNSELLIPEFIKTATRADLEPRTVKKRYLALLKTSVVVVLFLFYNIVTKTAMTVFNYYPTEIQGSTYLQQDMRCWQEAVWLDRKWP